MFTTRSTLRRLPLVAFMGVILAAAFSIAATAPAQIPAGASAGSGHAGLFCTDCHNPHGETTNIANIYEVLETPNSGPRTVVFTDTVGANSYADGDGVYDGVCEVCHTATAFHRNDASGDHRHLAGDDCTACHVHGAGFEVQATSVPRDGKRGLRARAFPSPAPGDVRIVIETAAGALPGPVGAVIHDVRGRMVRELRPESTTPGPVSLRWDGLDAEGRSVPSGVYLYRVRAGAASRTGRFVLVR